MAIVVDWSPVGTAVRLAEQAGARDTYFRQQALDRQYELAQSEISHRMANEDIAQQGIAQRQQGLDQQFNLGQQRLGQGDQRIAQGQQRVDISQGELDRKEKADWEKSERLRVDAERQANYIDSLPEGPVKESAKAEAAKLPHVATAIDQRERQKAAQVYAASVQAGRVADATVILNQMLAKGWITPELHAQHKAELATGGHLSAPPHAAAGGQNRQAATGAADVDKKITQISNLENQINRTMTPAQIPDMVAEVLEPMGFPVDPQNPRASIQQAKKALYDQKEQLRGQQFSGQQPAPGAQRPGMVNPQVVSTGTDARTGRKVNQLADGTFVDAETGQPVQ